jgi:hypothetical protein
VFSRHGRTVTTAQAADLPSTATLAGGRFPSVRGSHGALDVKRAVSGRCDGRGNDGMSTTARASPSQSQDSRAPRARPKVAHGDQVISQRLPSGSAMNAERRPHDRFVASATGVAPAATAAAKPGTAGASQRDARPSDRAAAAGRGLGGQVGRREERPQNAAEQKPGPGVVTARQLPPTQRPVGRRVVPQRVHQPTVDGANLRCVLQRLGRGHLLQAPARRSFPCSRWLGNVLYVTPFLAPE